MEQLTFWSGGLPAKTSLSPEREPDFLESVADWPSTLSAWLVKLSGERMQDIERMQNMRTGNASSLGRSVEQRAGGDPMTAQEWLGELERLNEAATPGPWDVWSWSSHIHTINKRPVSPDDERTGIAETLKKMMPPTSSPRATPCRCWWRCSGLL